MRISEAKKRYIEAIKNKDFKEFCSFVKVKDKKTGEYFSFSYDRWNNEQKQFYEKFSNKSRTKKKDVVIKPRQIGMTTFTAIQDYFYAITNPGHNVLIIAHDKQTTDEIFNLVKDIHQHFEDLGAKLKFKMVPELEKNNLKQIRFSNKSSIHIMVSKSHKEKAEKTGRGFTFQRMHCSEVSHWTYPVETMASILEAGSEAKEIVIESTPNGATGWFYETVSDLLNGKNKIFELHFFPWMLNPRHQEELDPNFDPKPQNQWEQALLETHKISLNQLQWFRNKVSAIQIDKALQEYPIDPVSCFRSTEKSFISIEDENWLLENIQNCESIQEIDNLTILNWEEPLPAERYIMGVDTGFGRSQDNSAFCIINSQGRIVCQATGNETPTLRYAAIALEFAKRYNTALVVCELQGPGHTTNSYFENEGYPNLYKHEHLNYTGFNTSPSSRTKMFMQIQNYIKDRANKIPDIGLVQELRTIKIASVPIYGEKAYTDKGVKDDRVLCFGMALFAWNDIPEITQFNFATAGRRDFCVASTSGGGFVNSPMRIEKKMKGWI